MKKIKVIILTTRFGGPYKWAKAFKKYVEKSKIPLDIRIRSSFWSLLISPFYVGDCDVVHSIQPIPFRFWRKPLILNPRGDFTSEFNLRNPWSILYPLAIKKADHIIVPSKYLKRKLKIKECTVIPNCLDLDNFPVKKSYKIGKELQISTVTSFAFKDKAEGVLEIIKILGDLKINKRIIFSIYAGGTYFNYVKKQAASMSVPENINVEFKGHVKNVHKELVNSDIFAYYSVHDNFPNAVLEAMACGMPIVSNNVGAVGEMIKSGKEGYAALNKDGYRVYLSKLIKSAKRNQFGRLARRKAKSDFSWNQIASKLYKLYLKNDLLSGLKSTVSS